MPLRRRPPEPSPRLRALLDGTGPVREGGLDSVGAGGAGAGGAGAGGAGAGGARSGPARPPDPDPADTVAEVVPWVPERSWLELPPGPRAGSPGPRAGSTGPPGGATGEPVVHRPGRHRRPRPPGPRLLTVPESLRGARLTAPRLATVGLLLVLAVAAVGFGARVAWARAASQPHVVAPAQEGSAVTARGSAAAAFATGGPTGAAAMSGAGTTADGAVRPGAAAPGSGQVVTVHVVGQVRHPGVLRLPVGSRVADAVERAGGATTHADLSAINLARPLVDGEQVRVPKPGEAVAPPAPAGPAGAGSGGAAGPAGGGSGLVNLNTASQGELEELPGVGPVLAQRILDWRAEHGRFTTVDELGEVSGVGEKTFAQLQPKVTV